MDQRYSPFRVDEKAVYAMASDKMPANTGQVFHASLAADEPPPDAAIRLAQRRVHAAMPLRGQRTDPFEVR